jgi:thiamine biosynthesis lipoprotein
VEAAFYAVDSAMSNWSAKSEVSRFNNLPPGEAIPVSEGLREVLEASGHVHAALAVYLIRPSANRLRSGDSAFERNPPARRAANTEGSAQFRLERTPSERQHVDSPAPGAIESGRIAKGYAVDRAAAAMGKHCLEYLVEAGGEIRLRGKWPVEIQHPAHEGGIARMDLEDVAVATSGVYANKKVVNGKRYSHIIHPRTGRPAHYAVSVTVTGASCAIADGLATALILADEKDYDAILKRFPGYGAVAFVKTTNGFRTIRAGAAPEIHCNPAARTSAPATAEASGTTTLLPNCL